VAHPSKESILRAASARFAENGLHATTMRDIASGADLHLPSIYYFFRNKEALYVVCADAAFQRTADRLQAPLSTLIAGAARLQRLAFVACLCEVLLADAELRAFLLQRHRHGSSWLLGTPLQAVVEQFAGLFRSPGDDPASDAIFADRLIGLALGDALGRVTQAGAAFTGAAADLPATDPAALLELLMPGWRAAA
jgi:AcrR family transcriptional regulator